MTATLLVIFLAGALTYFLAGGPLSHLHQFSARIEEIPTTNLSESKEIPDTKSLVWHILLTEC